MFTLLTNAGIAVGYCQDILYFPVAGSTVIRLISCRDSSSATVILLSQVAMPQGVETDRRNTKLPVLIKVAFAWLLFPLRTMRTGGTLYSPSALKSLPSLLTSHEYS